MEWIRLEGLPDFHENPRRNPAGGLAGLCPEEPVPSLTLLSATSPLKIPIVSGDESSVAVRIKTGLRHLEERITKDGACQRNLISRRLRISLAKQNTVSPAPFCFSPLDLCADGLYHAS